MSVDDAGDSIMVWWEDLAVTMEHYFFASCHGKGVSDSEGGRLKCLARRIEWNGVSLSDTTKLYQGVKEAAESLLPPPVGDKRKHSLWKRRLRLIGRGVAPRPAVKIDGMTGEVSKTHSFRGLGTRGTVEYRWLACSCFPCWTRLGQCEREHQNTGAENGDLTTSQAIDTRKSDEILRERGEVNAPKIKEGTVLALYVGSGQGTEGRDFKVVQAASKVREFGATGTGAFNTKEAINGAWVQRRNAQGKVFDAYVFVGKGETEFEGQGNGTRCTSTAVGVACSCGGWHRETFYVEGVRGPLMSLGRGQRAMFKRAPLHTTEVYALAPGAEQRIEDDIAECERTYNDTAVGGQL